MKLALITVLAAASASLLTACPLAPSCGGYAGAGDRVFARAGATSATDSLIACANGGIVQTLDDRYFEGRLDGDLVLDPATGAIRGTAAFTDDRSVTIGDVVWTSIDTTTVTLDHANELCAELETRAWWETPTSIDEPLPQATAFVSPSAIGGGTDTMLLCPDGHAVVEVVVASDGTTDDMFGSYTADAGFVTVTTEQFGANGDFENPTGLATDGAIVATDAGRTWSGVDPASVTLSCAE